MTIRINLAPAEARRKRSSGGIALPGFNLGILFGIVYLLAGAGVAYAWWTLTSEEARLTQAVAATESELQTVRARIGEGANLKAQLAEAKRRVQILEDITRGQERPIVMLDTFADTVPRDLWITGIEQKDGTLKVSGTAFSTRAVSDFMSNLKASGKFKDVEIALSRQALDKTPSLVTFEVTCRFEG